MTQSMSSSTIPVHFTCPLTLEMMQDPLCSKYGHNFERKAIVSWLEENDSCPMTRRPLLPSMLIPNNSLRLRIKSWKAANEAALLLDGDDDDLGLFQRCENTSGANSLTLENEDEIQRIRKDAAANADIADLLTSSCRLQKCSMMTAAR